MPPGIVLRTDYSMDSDEAWATFCYALPVTEREFFADQALNPTPGDGDNDADDVETPSGASDVGSKNDHASSIDGESSLAVFIPLSDVVRFGNILNLCALRLLFDVSACATPGPVLRSDVISSTFYVLLYDSLSFCYLLSFPWTI